MKVFFVLAAALCCASVSAQLFNLRQQQQRELTNAHNCGYNAVPAGVFPLVYGRDQVVVGTTSIKLTRKHLKVTYTLDPASGCTLNANDSVHVLLTSTEPIKNLAPGRFPCQSITNGDTTQKLKCPLGRFKSFQCCGPLLVYTHAALTCAGGASQTAYSGTPACTNLSKWCNVAQLTPSCECQCDATANQCQAKKTCSTCGEVICPATACQDKTVCADCGDEVCPVGTPNPGTCSAKTTCPCGEEVCPGTACQDKIVCADCGDEVCPADSTNPGSCTAKTTCPCGEEVCPGTACQDKIVCADCGEEVCPAGSPNPGTCSAKTTCPCGEEVCPGTACQGKIVCADCGDEVCPADSTNPGTCTAKTTCECGPDVCPNTACQPCSTSILWACLSWFGCSCGLKI
jgi:hypothetical protein